MIVVIALVYFLIGIGYACYAQNQIFNGITQTIKTTYEEDENFQDVYDSDPDSFNTLLTIVTVISIMLFWPWFIYKHIRKGLN